MPTATKWSTHRRVASAQVRRRATPRVGTISFARCRESTLPSQHKREFHRYSASSHVGSSTLGMGEGYPALCDGCEVVDSAAGGSCWSKKRADERQSSSVRRWGRV